MDSHPAAAMSSAPAPLNTRRHVVLTRKYLLDLFDFALLLFSRRADEYEYELTFIRVFTRVVEQSLAPILEFEFRM